MESFNFKNNYNGKLFSDCFSHVVIMSLCMGICFDQRFQCTYQGSDMGTIRVVAYNSRPFEKINNSLSFMECGQPSHYLQDLLQKEATENNIMLGPQTLVTHIIFQYTKRNIELHSYHMQEWWLSLLETPKTIEL